MRDLDALDAAVERLCCDYAHTPAPLLLTTVGELWRQVELDVPLVADASHITEPGSHRRVVVAAGWLRLLAGCLRHDMGYVGLAEADRRAAARLGELGGEPRIVAWSHEMAVWFSLSRRDYRAATVAAELGLEVASFDSVLLQLKAQRAKAQARLGGRDAALASLDSAREDASSLPPADCPANHFVVELAKLEFFCMDVYRCLGEDAAAELCAERVIADDATTPAPMRVAEARLTLAILAARRGDLDAMSWHSDLALSDEATVGRWCVPSLRTVGGELQAVLTERFPDATATEFGDRLAVRIAELERGRPPRGRRRSLIDGRGGCHG
ncbi:MAG TPA: XRE family transcriptional regulator [Mycobacteriales bacterium]|jgi:hypothetical protein|nr:XRE family transcriptional regulator [Mycobacteriales bacterium]